LVRRGGQGLETGSQLQMSAGHFPIPALSAPGYIGRGPIASNVEITKAYGLASAIG
jgi:hypothetical protein